ncbi:hypothetical protein [Kitasatospora sp. McL0602]|uniref:hypothetical protein n=1 Tax=Kitasatospora sp. McL0602 TaxID=3439530 RepID=UPI003F8BDB31
MEPYFFLSYARADDDGEAIARFHHDPGSSSLTARSNLALDLDGATTLRDRCAREAPATLGPDHPISRAARSGLRLEVQVEPLMT